MTSKSLPGRIPSETLGEVTSWMVPVVNDSGRVLSSAEKEARERRESLLRQGQEKIETVEIPEPEQTGISAQDLQAMFDAAEQEGFAQGREQGIAQGTQEGYEAGRQQGLMEMRGQLQAEQERFESITHALLNPLTAQDNDIEHLLLDVICTLTQSVIQRELQTDSSQIVDLVNAAVDALPIGSKNIRIALNPSDLPFVENYVKQQQLEWQFLADAQLQAGGCRVDTPQSRVDYSVSSRLQQVLEQFLTGQLAQSEGVMDSPEAE